MLLILYQILQEAKEYISYSILIFLYIFQEIRYIPF